MVGLRYRFAGTACTLQEDERQRFAAGEEGDGEAGNHRNDKRCSTFIFSVGIEKMIDCVNRETV